MTYRVLLDMDGILADFTAGTCALHGKDDPYLDPQYFGRYDIAKIMGIHDEKFWLPMQKDFWAELPITEEALDMVDFVTYHFGLENICILSSPNLNHESLAGKLVWIEKHLPKLRRQYLLGPRKYFCAAPRHILIDDHDDNVNGFNDAGGVGFLYPRPWNSRHVAGKEEAWASFLYFIEGIVSKRDRENVKIDADPSELLTKRFKNKTFK